MSKIAWLKKYKLDEYILDENALARMDNGNETMSIYPKIKDMKPEEQKIARQNLLKYCELDTLAMVKIWQELVKITKE